MNINDKEALARRNDMGKEACALRLFAARAMLGMSQTQLADATGTGKNSINNMEHARQFPNRDVMKYLHRAHGIDFNFLMNGDFHQFPPEFQDRLFDALMFATNQLGPSEDSDLRQAP
jgi:ribosome-binding protein aMBF1 (putative translation factor)